MLPWNKPNKKAEELRIPLLENLANESEPRQIVGKIGIYYKGELTQDQIKQRISFEVHEKGPTGVRGYKEDFRAVDRFTSGQLINFAEFTLYAK